MELGIERIAFHGELTVAGDEIFPRQGVHPLKERLKITGREGAKLHQHPCAAAEADIQPGDIRQRAVAVYPAVFRPDVLQIQAAHFVRHQTFQSKQAGNRQRHGPCLLSRSKMIE